MTNADKYLKDGVDIEELVKKMVGFELNIAYADEICHIGLQKQAERFKRFFAQPLKPAISEDEKVILRNIPKDYVKIRRSKWIIDEKRMNYGQLEIVDDKGKYWTLCILSHLFQFIKERRRI